jgi:hypothetical protein
MGWIILGQEKIVKFILIFVHLNQCELCPKIKKEGKKIYYELLGNCSGYQHLNDVLYYQWIY